MINWIDNQFGTEIGLPKSYGQYCSLSRGLDRVGERWTLLIIRELLISPKRYSDLRSALPGIATNLLADRLRSLQADGIVERYELPPPAASMVWRLTDAGRDLEEPVMALIRWGARWMLQPRRGEVFRAEWLALALKAVFVDPLEGDGLVVEIETEGDTVHLVLDADGSHARLGAAEAPDVRLKGLPSAILAAATGMSRLEELGDKRGSEVAGSRSAIKRLQRLIDSRRWEIPIPS